MFVYIYIYTHDIVDSMFCGGKVMGLPCKVSQENIVHFSTLGIAKFSENGGKIIPKNGPIWPNGVHERGRT
jgi:hypothetical protein